MQLRLQESETSFWKDLPKALLSTQFGTEWGTEWVIGQNGFSPLFVLLAQVQ